MLSALALSPLIFPAFDPVAIHLGPLAIRWYALAYIGGILLGWWYLGKIENRREAPITTAKIREDMIGWAVLGIMLGGRLGYVLFYNNSYYAEHWLEALKIWQGGMSFHGGMLGVIISFWLFARAQKINFIQLMDAVACVAPIGLFFGRLANFVNGELFGRVTTHPWGMVFPRGGELPRHPSQLYEAGAEGLALFLILLILLIYTPALKRTGLLSGVFLLGYGVFRFIIEYAREPDTQLGLLSLGFSMGQWLCLPMIIAGMVLLLRKNKL